MCHLDFNQSNVILDDTGKVWLIDWGLSGAYPPWFEEGMLAWGAASTWCLGLLDMIKDEAYQEDVARLSSILFALTTGGYCLPRPRGSDGYQYQISRGAISGQMSLRDAKTKPLSNSPIFTFSFFIEKLNHECSATESSSDKKGLAFKV